MTIVKTGLISTLNRIWAKLGRDRYDMFKIEDLPNQRMRVEFRAKTST